MSLRKIVLYRFLATTACLLSFASLAPAQSERERERDLNDRDIELRSWNLKILSLSANKQPKPKIRPEQAMAQVQEDFTRIQVLNRNLIFAIAEKRPVNYGFITKSVAEIRKRSERLNDNLALPEADLADIETPTPVTNTTQLQLSLLKLGNLIYSFTKNPFFRQPTVLDAEQTIKARRELLEIVELSGQIKKDSERLGKNVH